MKEASSCNRALYSNKRVGAFFCLERVHHITPDEQGRLVVQGLLTSTLPTKVGGDHNLLARKMNFEFLRPVYTEDTIICEERIYLINSLCE